MSAVSANFRRFYLEYPPFDILCVSIQVKSSILLSIHYTANWDGSILLHSGMLSLLADMMDEILRLSVNSFVCIRILSVVSICPWPWGIMNYDRVLKQKLVLPLMTMVGEEDWFDFNICSPPWGDEGDDISVSRNLCCNIAYGLLHHLQKHVVYVVLYHFHMPLSMWDDMKCCQFMKNIILIISSHSDARSHMMDDSFI